MKKENIILQKTFDFSLSVIEMYKTLIYKKKEYVMSKQLLKAGTSVGANSNEAVVGQSKKDFVAKLSIARKEGYETKYWIDLLRFSEYLTYDQTKRTYELLEECMKLICSSIKTSKESMEKKK